jgi:hypothetical protein
MEKLNVIGAYPDDDSTKTVILEAWGFETVGRTEQRHVMITWLNDIMLDGETVASQFVQLRGTPGSYSIEDGNQVCRLRSIETLENYRNYKLGDFDRGGREKIIRLSNEVSFDPGSFTDGCRVWTRQLLMAMQEEGLVEQEVVDMICEDVILPEPTR